MAHSRNPSHAQELDMRKMPATMTVRDDGGHLAVLIERGHGWEIVLTTPTHRGAQVHEARERGWAEATQRARDIVERYERIYDVTLVDA
jgi:hypothetical protein